MNNLFDLTGKIIIVTGNYRGNGKVIANGLASLGAIVYGIDLKIEKNKPDKKTIDIECDITNYLSFSKICKDIFDKHKKIDGLINNAGVTFTKDARDKKYPEDWWDKTLEINLKSIFINTQEVIIYMKMHNSGSIINITSLGAELGFPNNPAYQASKGGLKMLTKSFARDFGRDGIRVNNIAPGYIKTDMTLENYNNETIKKQREQNIMLGRWGESEDLIGSCVFLLSDASKYITAQDLFIDGGWSSNGLQFI